MIERETVSVLITGIGGATHGMQVLKALKLADTDYHFIGVNMNNYAKGLYEVDEAYCIPAASEPVYVETLLKLCEERNVKVLIHGSEPELKVLSNNRGRFEDRKIFLPINMQSIINLCMNKQKCFQWLSGHGFTVPETFEVNEMSDLMRPELFPLVIKPGTGGGGSIDTYIVQTQEDAEFYYQFFNKKNCEMIAQEYVGTPDDEFTVGILHDMNGNYINAIAVNRFIMNGLSNRLCESNRTDNVKLSKTLAISNGISQGEVGRFPKVTETCKKIAEKLESCGPLNIQGRLIDREFYPFEINPRFSGTTSLRAMVGFNEPDILIRKHLFNEDAEPDFDYKKGVIVRGLDECFIEPDQVVDDFRRE